MVKRIPILTMDRRLRADMWGAWEHQYVVPTAVFRAFSKREDTEILSEILRQFMGEV